MWKHSTKGSLIKWIFSSGQGRGEWRKVANRLYIDNFLEFSPDADMVEIVMRHTGLNRRLLFFYLFS